ncbi:hypothetical protein [Micromonospora sp. DT227]|uniref:hypothetical protein n=1 Tax=Micromonospora sp. DT227 TaxID=3393433 RepID=UPI003CE8AC48
MPLWFAAAPMPWGLRGEERKRAQREPRPVQSGTGTDGHRYRIVRHPGDPAEVLTVYRDGEPEAVGLIVWCDGTTAERDTCTNLPLPAGKARFEAIRRRPDGFEVAHFASPLSVHVWSMFNVPVYLPTGVVMGPF